ncbi:MAG: TonB-dependent receptor [Pseudomonadota bacterium]
MLKPRYCVIGLLAGLVAAPPVVAQALEEIVVTATRRAESLQEVPIAVTAVTAEDLEAYNITDSGRLALVTPGLIWSNSDGARAWPTLRGVVTSNGEANGEPAIGFFVDGIYKSRTAQANAPLLDVERVEVLRGPQGTLFGRNSTGGSINVISKLPDFDDFGFVGDITLGDFSNVMVDGVLNLPLSEAWALRVAARRHTRDGFVENLGPGPDLSDQDMTYGRLSLAYDGGPLQANFRAAYRRVDRTGGGAFTNKVIGQSFDPSIPGRSVFGQPFFVNPRLNDGIPDVDIMGTPTDIGVATDPDPFVARTDFPVSETLDSLDTSLEITYEFGAVEFRSLTGYADYSHQPFSDNDYSDLTAVLNRVDSLTAEAETLQQEFQLLSNGDGNWNWVVGVFFMQDEVFETFSIQQFDTSNVPAAVFPSPAGGTTSFVFDRRTNTDIDSQALYGQASYRFTDQFQATVGGRWSRDDKDYRLREFGFLGVLGFNPDLDLSEEFDDFTWRVGAEYFMSDTTMFYGSVSTGFRSGGFNRFLDDPATPGNETIFDSEEITAFEIGTKNRLLDGNMRLNLAAFVQEIDDQQVGTVLSVAGTGQSGFFNAGKTEITGLEAEMQWQINEPWYLFGTATLLNAEFDEFMAPGFAGDVGLIDLAGNDVPRAPAFRATLSSAYDFSLAGGATLTPSVTGQFSSSYHLTQFNTAIDEQDSYAKFDARLVYRSADERWRLEAYVENLTEEEIQSYGVYGGSNAYFVNYEAPRMYGLRATFEY